MCAKGKLAKGNPAARDLETEAMEAAQQSAIVESVRKMVASLDALDSSLREAAARKRQDPGSADVGERAAVQNVEDNAKQLHLIVNAMTSQRVIMLPADQLMEAGVVLYNSARAVFKSYQARVNDDESRDPCGARFPILFVRFMAARVMGLALSCSKVAAKGVRGDGARDQGVYVDDCLDVLRSYGRVGSLLMETAAVESAKCFEYLTLAKEALDHASSIWGKVGLSYLTRFKDGVELEEILQDLWDFCVDRVRTIRLLQSYEDSNSAVSVIIETLHELQMLLPYMLGNTKGLFEVIQHAMDEWSNSDRHNDLVALGEEALRMCDAVEATQDITQDSLISPFKRVYLGRLLTSLAVLGEVEKAEACFSLLGTEKDSSAVLTMTKLYLQNQEREKASLTLKYLFQRDDVTASIAGARLFVEANSFSEESLQIYRQLERHYGDHVLDIGLDLARTLAASESSQHRAQAISELTRVSEMVAGMPRERLSTGQNQVARMRHIIHDAAGAALNNNAHEECVAWAELGIQQATSPQETAVFQRIIAAAYLKLNRPADSRRWADEAFKMDSSKSSIFSAFEASLGVGGDNGGDARDILRLLREREDFEAADLVSYGYAANCAGRDDLTLLIMDDLCSILRDNRIAIDELPYGTLIQNTAQLALKAMSTVPETHTSCTSELIKYADMFLEAAQRLGAADIEKFASETAFVWFYTMSFNVARSCNYGVLFVRAADFASEALKFFGEKCAISSREHECLLAALSSDMARFESIDHTQLGDLLGVIDRIKSLCLGDSDYDDFLAKTELAIKLRLFDADVESMKVLCQEKMHKDVSNFIEIGELILQAARFDEAKAVRHSYRFLASEMFKRGLQLLLQSDNIDQGNLSYFFRRLITLAESRDDTIEWFDQLLQLEASVDIKFSDLDAEWFIAKAWNLGVRCHRSRSHSESKRFMKIALALLENIGSSLTRLGKDLHQQYHDLSTLEDGAILNVD